MDSTGNVVREKSFLFAVRIVNLERYLCRNHKEYVLSKQLVRSGTSIGANIEEALAGQSRRDFIAKMAIASKETRETCYWIRLLIATGYLNKERTAVKTLQSDCEELTKLLTSIVKTSQEN
ncbi:MAG: four helix bundle protein [Candidatus Thiodiazotropha sp. (ex Monitilora ramsayi)]|nr:four helix bundle protein [Candidatus Thiodiazotropha sp. (ex Monitilora ramsayi)]